MVPVFASIEKWGALGSRIVCNRQEQPVYKGRKMMWQNIVEEGSCLYRELENSKPEQSRDAELKGNQPKIILNPLCAQELTRANKKKIKNQACLFSDFLFCSGAEKREERANTQAWIPLPVFPPSTVLEQWLQQLSDLHQNFQSWPKVPQQLFLAVFYPSEKVLTTFLIFWDIFLKKKSLRGLVFLIIALFNELQVLINICLFCRCCMCSRGKWFSCNICSFQVTYSFGSPFEAKPLKVITFSK